MGSVFQDRRQPARRCRVLDEPRPPSSTVRKRKADSSAEDADRCKEEKGVPLRFRELEGGVETDPNSSRVCGIFTTGSTASYCERRERFLKTPPRSRFGQLCGVLAGTPTPLVRRCLHTEAQGRISRVLNGGQAPKVASSPVAARAEKALTSAIEPHPGTPIFLVLSESISRGECSVSGARELREGSAGVGPR